MKKIILIVALLLSAVTLNAQSYQSIFGKDSTAWMVSSRSMAFNQEFSLLSLVSYNDTINYNGQDYKKIMAYYLIDSSSYYLMREDTILGKVWIVNRLDGLEYLFYDFSLQVGDTFTYPNYRSQQANPPADCQTVVDSVKYIEGRKHIYLAPRPDSCMPFTYNYTDDTMVVTFIEGIGANLSTRALMGVGYKGEYLGCYYRDGIKIADYIDVKGHCDSPQLGVSSLPGLSAITLRPNPVRTQLYLDKLPRKPCTLQLYDVMGRAVLEHNTNGVATQLDMSSLLPGLYMLRISAAGYTPYYTKVVKE